MVDMSARYSTSIEAILEDAEDESRQLVLRPKDDDTASEAARRQSRAWFDSNMPPYKPNTGREREKAKKHKSSATTPKHQSKSKSKTRRGSGAGRDGDSPHGRPRRAISNQSASSASSSDEDEPVQDHRIVLAAARARLTSPSLVSQSTALTTATKNSSGSSGSNSTVTQDSVTRRPSQVKRPEPDEAPLSPAVPDPPDVFAFLVETESILDNEEAIGGTDSGSEEEEDEEEEDEEDETSVQWPPGHPHNDYASSDAPSPTSQVGPASGSSSASSSFHGEDDVLSLPAEHDNDTDRSSSPENSIKGHESEQEHDSEQEHESESDDDGEHEHEESAATDPVSVKIATQMAAARQRQNLHESMQQFSPPHIQRINTSIPNSPSSLLTPRYQPPQPKRYPLSPVDDLPVTGYELLASRLSGHAPDSDDGTRIKPMYRKFEALNHRLLLHLQDEISELEEQLHHLDRADTQSRKTDLQIVPASRRAAAQAGGELQWHKTDVLGKIGYKLAQYNQALSSFNTTQSLSPPDPDDISTYRTYLQTENPIAEAETHFLNPTDDLVSVYSDNLRPPQSNRAASYAASNYSENPHSAPSTFPPSPVPYDLNCQPNALPGLASAIAASILIPILTFNVIPGFIGRLTVTLLVALGVVGALLQSGILNRASLLGMESVTCAGIYGGVMIIIAGIMA